MSFPDDQPPQFSHAQWQRAIAVFRERYPHAQWSSIPLTVRVGFVEELILKEGPTR